MATSKVVVAKLEESPSRRRAYFTSPDGRLMCSEGSWVREDSARGTRDSRESIPLLGSGEVAEGVPFRKVTFVPSEKNATLSSNKRVQEETAESPGSPSSGNLAAHSEEYSGVRSSSTSRGGLSAALKPVENDTVAHVERYDHELESSTESNEDVSRRSQARLRLEGAEGSSIPSSESSEEDVSMHLCAVHSCAASTDRGRTLDKEKKSDDRQWRKLLNARPRNAKCEGERSAPRPSQSLRLNKLPLSSSSQAMFYWSPPQPVGAFVELPNMNALSRYPSAASPCGSRRTCPTGSDALPRSEPMNAGRKRGRNVAGCSSTDKQRCLKKTIEVVEPNDTSKHTDELSGICISQNCLNYSSIDLDSEIDPWLVVASLPPRGDIPYTPDVRLPEPEPEMRHRPTLVLDLDETLVHCSTEFFPEADFEFCVHFQGSDYNVYVKRRPHLNAFLKYASSYFEVVVFTASQAAYADRLLDILDPHNDLIHHRLFRDACVYVAGNYLKDLSVLNRDLRRTVIVDNSPQAFGYHVENGVPILTWTDDEKDCELIQLILLLEEIRKEVERGSGDVRYLVERRFRNTNRVAFYRAFLSALVT